MSFKIDKQTLTDLAVFGTGKSQSVYEIFNRTHTRGGARLLEDVPVSAFRFGCHRESE